MLEAYLADLHAAMAGRPEHGIHVGVTGLFLTAVRQHGWAPDLPPDAMIFPGDQPPRTELPPRALAGHVMAQVEQPGNLARRQQLHHRNQDQVRKLCDRPPRELAALARIP